MPYTAQDTIGQRIESVVQRLRALSDQSASSQAALTNLERILDTIGSVNLGNLERSVEILAQFNRNLALMPGGAEAIREVQQETQSLVRTMAELNTQIENRSARVNLGNQQEVINRVNAVPGFLRTAEQNIDLRQAQGLAPGLLEQSQRTRDELRRADQITQETIRYAEGIYTGRKGILERLIASARDVERLGNVYNEPRPPELMGTQVTRTPVTKWGITWGGRGGTPGTLGTNVSDLATDPGTEAAKKATTTVDFNRSSAFGNLKELGLSSTAIKNLTDQLNKLGVTSGEVSKPVKDLNTGITTFSMTSDAAGQATQKYTAHIDNAGNLLQSTQNKFRSFGSAIMRDTVEVLKWTIAISLIYTPIRKVGEMLEQAKQIQLDMVDVQIALGSSTRSLGEIFQTTADIATQTSSAIEGVIEGYGLAIAASASAGSEFQRSATTTALLRDSMILSKLANIEQKEALDILVGAMSQLGLGLTQGTQLLDSWVAVSKKANVSINQLATSFAIVGSAAEEVGLNYNELNAIIGTLAQSTTLSANEVGNAARGIIAAMQTDKAQAEFAKYGIATKTITGDFRDFMDVLRDMKILQQGGILDDKAMAALTQAGGAGARRGAQLSALVQDLGKAFELINVSEAANGEAAAAMALETETLDAATTRLNNSFAMLAQTLGGEGGVLSFMTGVTNAATGLVNVMRTLVNITKGAAPVLATLMLLKGAAGTASGAKILSATIPSFLQQILTPQIGGNTLQSRLYTSANYGATGISGRGPVGGFAPLTNALLMALQRTGIGINKADNRGATYGEMLGGLSLFMNRPLFGGKLGGANLMSMLGPAAVLSSNIGKPLEEGGPRAGLGALGALPGILKGSPVWATIGAVIATGFYDEFLTFTDDIAASWTKWRTEAEANNPPPPDEDSDSKDVLAYLDKQIKGTLNLDQKWAVNMDKWIMNASKFFNPSMMSQFPNVGESESLLGMYLRGGKSLGGKQILTPEQMQMVSDFLSEFVKQQLEMGLITNVAIPSTPIETLVVEQINSLSSFAADASAEMMQIALEDIAKGAPGAIKNYLDLQSVAQQYASVAGNLLVAQEMVAETAAPGAMANVPQFNQTSAVGFVSKLNTEELGMVSSLLTEIVSGQNAYNTAIAEGRNVTDTEKASLAALQESIANAKNEYIQLIPVIQSAIDMRIVETKLLTSVDLPEGITPEQRQQILTAAEKLWREVFEASGIPKEVIDNYIKNQRQQILTANGEIIGGFTQIPQQYITQAAGNLGIPMTPQPLNLQNQQDLTMSQIPSLLARYYQALNAIKTNFPTYESETEPVGLILKDGFYQQDLDLKILNMVLNDILDETKKQGLQGIYNLPEGATFMIPVTAFELDQQTRAEGTGGGGWGPNPFENYPTTPPEEIPDSRITTHREQMIARNAGEGAYGGLGDITESSPLPVSVTNWFDQSQQNATPGTFTPVPQIDWQNFWKNAGGEPGLSTPVNPPAPTTPPEPQLNFLEKLFQWLSNLQLLPQFNIVPESNTQGSVPTTNLNLDMESVITLTVDGRTLATIVKPFLYQDLIRYMTSANSSVNRSVVG